MDGHETLKKLADDLGILDHKQPEPEEPQPEPVWYQFVAEAPDWNASREHRALKQWAQELGEKFNGL